MEKNSLSALSTKTTKSDKDFKSLYSVEEPKKNLLSKSEDDSHEKIPKSSFDISLNNPSKIQSPLMNFTSTFKINNTIEQKTKIKSIFDSTSSSEEEIENVIKIYDSNNAINVVNRNTNEVQKKKYVKNLTDSTKKHIGKIYLLFL